MRSTEPPPNPTARTFDDAFAPLFEVAMRPALRILRSVDDAEDIAAEVLARVYVDWVKLGQQPWIEAWIVRVATNLSIDRLRRQQRRLPRIEPNAKGELEVRLDLASA